MLDIRRDPIVGAWVLVRDLADVAPNYKPVQPDPTATCMYCAGNERQPERDIYRLSDDDGNWQVRVVPHSHPRLQPEEDYKLEGVGFYDTVSGTGTHEVVIETPQHGLTIPQMSLAQVERILQTYKSRLEALLDGEHTRYVLLFKHHPQVSPLAGAVSGHETSEILAIPATPLRIKSELDTARRFFSFKERCQFCDIIDQEIQTKERFVAENNTMIAFCPFASRFPFEVWVMPKDHQHNFALVDADQLRDLADILHVVLSTFQDVLNYPPYDYILHTCPNLIPRRGYWKTLQEDYHWRLEITPRLFQDLGFEYSTGFYINNTPPEVAAKALREHI